jgi:putative transposase
MTSESLISVLSSIPLFTRNKLPLEIKLFAIATYLVSSSVRRTASVLGVGKSSVHYWITRFKESLDYKPEKVKSLGIVRLGVDETILRYNGRKCYLFAAIDLERNKIIHLRVYSARNSMTSHACIN